SLTRSSSSSTRSELLPKRWKQSSLRVRTDISPSFLIGQVRQKTHSSPISQLQPEQDRSKRDLRAARTVSRNTISFFESKKSLETLPSIPAERFTDCREPRWVDLYSGCW